jgi:DNA-binding transcriptional regulator GbsR (MarR family)
MPENVCAPMAQTSNTEHRTSNTEHRTSNTEPKNTIQKLEMMKVEATRYYDLEERLLEFSVWIIRLSEPQNPVPAPN